MKQFFKSIFQNIPAKIICLLVAIGLWIYVGSGLAQIGTFPGKIPLEFNNTANGLVAVCDIAGVSVKIVAASNLWKTLGADSFKAKIDLSGYAEGTYELPVKVISQNPEVQVVEINPAKVIVRVEKTVEKEVPINLRVEGKAADGYVVGDWKIKPDKVKIIGGSSQIGNIFEATAKITLSNERDNLQRIVKVIALDSNGNEIRNLKFNPAEVEVQVPLVQASSAKTVGIKVVTTGLPQQGYWVSQIETEPSTLAVTASAEIINNISFIETNQININGLSQIKEYTATLKPSVGITILDQITTVKVKIITAPIGTTRQFQAGFSWQNLTSGLRVGSVDPEIVTLVVSGPSEDLVKLSVEDIALNINLGAFSKAGVYSVDISRSNVSLPSGVSFSSVVPSAINVKLENR